MPTDSKTPEATSLTLACPHCPAEHRDYCTHVSKTSSQPDSETFTVQIKYETGYYRTTSISTYVSLHPRSFFPSWTAASQTIKPRRVGTVLRPAGILVPRYRHHPSRSTSSCPLATLFVCHLVSEIVSNVFGKYVQRVATLDIGRPISASHGQLANRTIRVQLDELQRPVLGRKYVQRSL